MSVRKYAIDTRSCTSNGSEYPTPIRSVPDQTSVLNTTYVKENARIRRLVGRGEISSFIRTLHGVGKLPPGRHQGTLLCVGQYGNL